MLVALMGIAWGVSQFHALRQESTIKKIANRILLGDVYKYDILLNQASLVPPTQRPEFCRPMTNEIMIALYKFTGRSLTQELFVPALSFRRW